MSELQKQTTESHSIQIDLDVFANKINVPEGPMDKHEAQNFLLAADSIVIDKGTLLPNFNEDFSGLAPDIGAYEFDSKPPTYGPNGFTESKVKSTR